MDINRLETSSLSLAASVVDHLPSCRERLRARARSMSLFWFMSKNGRDGCGGGGGVELEVTVLSAESLRLPPSYSPLPRRLRPYVTVSSATSASSTAVAAGASGAREHQFDDTLVVPVGAEFLEGRDDVHVAVFSEASCRLVGATPLGWCRIPAADVLDGLRPPRALRRLSYSLRCPSGRGVVHLAVRVLGDVDARLAPPPPPAQPGWCRVAMGVPVSGASAAAAAVGMPWAWGETSR